MLYHIISYHTTTHHDISHHLFSLFIISSIFFCTLVSLPIYSSAFFNFVFVLLLFPFPCCRNGDFHGLQSELMSGRSAGIVPGGDGDLSTHLGSEGEDEEEVCPTAENVFFLFKVSE